jgi:hypothetical protein
MHSTLSACFVPAWILLVLMGITEDKKQFIDIY